MSTAAIRALGWTVFLTRTGLGRAAAGLPLTEQQLDAIEGLVAAHEESQSAEDADSALRRVRSRKKTASIYCLSASFAFRDGSASNEAAEIGELSMLLRAVYPAIKESRSIDKEHLERSIEVSRSILSALSKTA